MHAARPKPSAWAQASFGRLHQSRRCHRAWRRLRKMRPCMRTCLARRGTPRLGAMRSRRARRRLATPSLWETLSRFSPLAATRLCASACPEWTLTLETCPPSPTIGIAPSRRPSRATRHFGATRHRAWPTTPIRSASSLPRRRTMASRRSTSVETSSSASRGATRSPAFASPTACCTSPTKRRPATVAARAPLFSRRTCRRRF
mmetsp:Transcript_3930/g.12705  ORF Transcript_3930/g.12705 Transcript_3930/m.12705 type:complete len:203 (-) Transcript_3930:264-872(-)